MKGVHSQPLLLFLCWFMAWGGLKRLLIFIVLRQTAFGIKGQGSKGKGGRAAEVQKTRMETGVKSKLWALEENVLLKPSPVACWSLVWSESAGVSVLCCVVVNMHGSVCVFMARTCLQVCVQGERWNGDLGRTLCAGVRQVHKKR